MEFLFADYETVEGEFFETTVPAEFRGLYTKGADGNYTLNEAFKATAATIDGLSKNLKTAKTTNSQVGKEAKERREALEKIAALGLGATPEEISAKVAELNEKLASGSKIKPEEVRAAIEKEYADKFKAAEDTNKGLMATLTETLVDSAALAALNEHKGNAKLLMPTIRASVAVFKDEETGKYYAGVKKPDGSVRAGPDGGPLPVSKFVEELKADKDFGSAFAGSGQSGSGLPANKTPPQQRQQQEQQGQSPVSKISAGLRARG